MAKRPEKPRLAVAGPGAGKTHSMVDEIVAVLPTLPPFRYLAAITYTNAAANTIRERLHQRVRVRKNIFIGTTHAFTNRFILGPCAKLLEHLPEDPIFAAIDVHAKGTGAARYTENLIKKGIVPYDAMVPVARKVLAQKCVRERISQRIAFLFVDEFQDTDIGTLEILDHFRKSGRTTLYAVGDPEQFVMGFTYRGTTLPNFDQLPFFRFHQNANTLPLAENHRSNGEIVKFANRFRDDIQQTSIKPFRNEERVLFIEDDRLPKIIETFRALSANVKAEHGPLSRLYLSEENATFDGMREEFAIKHTSNGGRKTSTLLGDALELIATGLDRTPRKVCEDFELSRLQWRRSGTTLLQKAKTAKFQVEELYSYLLETFGHKVSKSRRDTLQDGLDNLQVHLATDSTQERSEQSASIRRAKGLEADAVLVVALGIGELKKWLLTSRDQRNADRQDKCRLGYVAFTRPREMLCIACLKPIDDEVRRILVALGVGLIPRVEDAFSTVTDKRN